MERDCICDICVEAYLELYDKIAVNMDILYDWGKRMPKSSRDKINGTIHKRIRDKTEEKKATIKVIPKKKAKKR